MSLVQGTKNKSNQILQGAFEVGALKINEQTDGGIYGVGGGDDSDDDQFNIIAMNI